METGGRKGMTPQSAHVPFDTVASRVLADSFGRVITNVRVSVTDRCNFRCRYCMPDNGIVWLKKDDLLSFEEITRIVRVLAGHGVTHVRLTGGEPLMRHDLPALVRQIRAIKSIADLALTTNGYFLTEQIDSLAAAGLGRLNVSMDSLDPATFSAMARRDYFDRVWNGVEAAERRGLRPIKINAVLIRGVNEGEIPRFVGLARERGLVIRFIEFMPIGKDDGWSPDQVVPTREVLDTIRGLGLPELISTIPHGAEPAEIYRFADGRGEIGFISSVSDPFCSSCNRIRVTSDGKLRTCLFSATETDLRALLRSGAGDDRIGEAITTAVLGKEEGHLINRPGFVRPERTMHQIGG
jgi:cyclic pyranopterin phosphate synthase